MNLNPLAVLGATVAVFVVSTIYYTVFAEQLATARTGTRGADQPAGRPPLWKMLAEILRSLVLATAIAGLVAAIGVSDVGEAVLLGLGLWVAFPVILWSGAILWENAPPRLAVVHAGDWLLKLLVISVVVGLWR
jgi:hypothetical protein